MKNLVCGIRQRTTGTKKLKVCLVCKYVFVFFYYTGTPKGAMISNGNMIAGVASIDIQYKEVCK